MEKHLQMQIITSPKQSIYTWAKEETISPRKDN